jgi:hypothetical protein
MVTLDLVNLSGCLFNRSDLTECDFVSITWNPEQPPEWPPGFDPPPNAWEANDHHDPA